ncbi:hypothetical protein ABVK25_003704 [Lepraria finkii]|uniref:Nephrocystin 3-like N-terminal domain-containing protein n=1 Tax=Lepraria finkii TaxID=1340010 RepID=A0ABR4BGA5_9LECA
MKDPKMMSWFEPNFSCPNLWLRGIPGAGKTVLTSMMVEEAVRLGSCTFTYVYCKYKDGRKDNFKAIARALLNQMVRTNQDLVPHLYEECVSSGQVVLDSEKQLRTNLKKVCQCLEDSFLIIDGIDECNTVERRKFLTFVPPIVGKAKDVQENTMRGLFINRDEGSIRRMFSQAVIRKIGVNDNSPDIRSFTALQVSKLVEKFEISEAIGVKLISMVTGRAKGELV